MESETTKLTFKGLGLYLYGPVTQKQDHHNVDLFLGDDTV